MDTPQETREKTPAVLAVAFGLLLVWVAVASVAKLVLRGGPQSLDGSTLFQERFANAELPSGFDLVEALRLAQGEELVVLAPADGWAERRAEEMRVWSEVDKRQAKSQKWGGGGPGGPGGPGGRGRGRGGPPGGFGGFGGSDAQKSEWANVPGADSTGDGAAPGELAFVWYPRRVAEKVIPDQFGRRRFGDLSTLGSEGGKITVSSGPVAWSGYDTLYAIERQYAKIEGEKTFRDVLRMNLSLGDHCCVLYAKWPQGVAGSVEAVSELLRGFEPLPVQPAG